MNANIPIMQLLGSAAGIGGTASPTAAPAPVGQSAFGTVMGNLLSAATGTGLATGANGSAASLNSTSGQSILAALQSGQITPEMIAALNSGQASGSLAALAAKLAGLMSGGEQGTMVPLAAGLNLDQLQAAGIELPAGLSGGAGEGQAMLLVRREALKSLMADGGWQDGASVPALLMLGSENGGRQPVGYLDVSLSMVAATGGSGSSPALSFQLNIDPAATINIASGLTTNLIPDLTAASGQESSDPAAGSPILELAGLLTRLKALAASARGGQDAAAGDGAGSATGEHTQTITETDMPLATAVSAVSAEAASALPGAAVGVAGADLSTAQPAIKSERAALPPLEKLTAEIEKLINKLTTGINEAGSAASGDTAGSGVAVLNLLAGQAAVSAENGDTRAAGQTLELIGKLGKLSSLSAGEKQQVLADLAGRLRSLLSPTGNAGAAATNPAAVSRGEISLQALPSLASATETSPSGAAVPGKTLKTEAAAERLVASASSTNISAGQPADPGAQNTVQLVNDTVAATVADPVATQGAGQAPAGASGILSALESAAATAGELADKAVVATTGKDPASAKATAAQPADPGAPQAQPSAATVQAAVAKAATAGAQTTTSPVSPQVAEAGQAAPAVDKSEGRRNEAGRTDIRPATDSDAGTTPVALAATGESESRQVSVPVSLSSLRKTRRGQSKTQAIKAVNAFTDNSQAAAKAGESNDFMQALRAAAGEKGVDDLVEVTLVDKKSGGEELLVRPQSAEHSAKPGGSQLQAGLRIESSGVRQPDTARGEQQLRQVQVHTAGREEAFEKIISSARLTRAGSTSELTMKLEPEHLGMLRVKMSVDKNNVMHARIQVESHEARTMIESNLPRLRESLAEQGIRVEKFNVDVRQDQQGQQQQHAGAGNGGEYDQAGRGLGGNAGGSAGGDPAGSGNQPESVDRTSSPVNKYGYSTLEWVA